MATSVLYWERTMSEAPGSTRFDAAPLSSEHQTKFVEQNMRRVFLLIYRMVGNVADAQDLTQEAFIKALQRQDQLKDLDKAAHWLSRIAGNTAIDFLRRAGRESGATGAARRASRAFRNRPRHIDRARAHRAAVARRGGNAGCRSCRAAELLQGDCAEPHRQRQSEAPEVFPNQGARMKRHATEADVALYVSGDLD